MNKVLSWFREKPSTDLIATILVALILMGRWLWLNREIEHGRRDRMMDFATYYLASRIILRGMDVYQISSHDWYLAGKDLGLGSHLTVYIYSPLLALLMISIAVLPYPWAALIWGAATIWNLCGSGVGVRPAHRAPGVADVAFSPRFHAGERDDELRPGQRVDPPPDGDVPVEPLVESPGAGPGDLDQAMAHLVMAVGPLASDVPNRRNGLCLRHANRDHLNDRPRTLRGSKLSISRPAGYDPAGPEDPPGERALADVFRAFALRAHPIASAVSLPPHRPPDAPPDMAFRSTVGMVRRAVRGRGQSDHPLLLVSPPRMVPHSALGTHQGKDAWGSESVFHLERHPGSVAGRSPVDPGVPGLPRGLGDLERDRTLRHLRRDWFDANLGRSCASYLAFFPQDEGARDRKWDARVWRW